MSHRLKAAKKLRKYMVFALKSQGYEGLDEVVNDLHYRMNLILESSCPSYEDYCLHGDFVTQLQIIDNIVDNKVISLLIQKLVHYRKSSGDQSLLVKALDVITKHFDIQERYILISPIMIDILPYSKMADPHPGLEFSNYRLCKPTRADCNLLIELWSETSDEDVLKSFVNLFSAMTQGYAYERIFASSKTFVNSCANMTRFILLRRYSGYCCHFDIFQQVMLQAPYFLLNMIKSATYFVNCWRLLSAMDMFVEVAWIKKHLCPLVEEMMYRFSISASEFELSAVHVGRFFRCLTFAIVKTPTSADSFLLDFLERYIFLVGRRYFTASVRGENMQILGSFTLFSKHELQQLIGEGSKLSYDAKKALDFMMEHEEHLQPFTRADANIFEVPKHVNDALNLIPDGELFLEQEIGCQTLLRDNIHKILSTCLTKRILVAIEESPFPCISMLWPYKRIKKIHS